MPHNLLDVYQARGAVAAYIKSLESDLKSIAASGWGPELIPDDEILQSQFPKVLEQIEQETARMPHARHAHRQGPSEGGRSRGGRVRSTPPPMAERG